MSQDVNPDKNIKDLCCELWAPLEGQLAPCALLSRPTPFVLIDAIINWNKQTTDKFVLRRKFSSSFGSLRQERETVMSYEEMKRTASNYFTISALRLILSHYKGATEESREIVIRSLEIACLVINEVHNLSNRRSACEEILKTLFKSISEYAFDALLSFTSLKIGDLSKLPSFDLFIRSFAEVKLTIYPAEELDSTLNLVEILASYYTDAKQAETREAFGFSLAEMLRPIIEVVSAEVNLPKWDKVFAKILFSRVSALCEKQKYRAMTVRLAVIVVCLCKKSIFEEKWLGLAEAIAILIRVMLVVMSDSCLHLGWKFKRKSY